MNPGLLALGIGGEGGEGRAYEAVGILLVASNTALAYRLYQFSKMSREGMDHPSPPARFFKGGGRGEGSGGREMSLLEFIYLSFSSTLLHGRLFTFKKIPLEI